MKVTRFLFFTFGITFLSIVYVWQNIYQIELSYRILQREKIINNLIEKNRILKYNVAQLKSPYNIEKRLLTNGLGLKYIKPAVVVAELEKESSDLKFTERFSLIEKINQLVNKIFAVKSEAEAKP